MAPPGDEVAPPNDEVTPTGDTAASLITNIITVDKVSTNDVVSTGDDIDSKSPSISDCYIIDTNLSIEQSDNKSPI